MIPKRRGGKHRRRAERWVWLALDNSIGWMLKKKRALDEGSPGKKNPFIFTSKP